MDDHEYQHKFGQSSSEANGDKTSIDDDRIMIIPDTPDREGKNHSNSRTCRLENAVSLDGRVPYFVDNIQTSKIDSHHRSDFDDIDRNCHDGSPAAPSSKAVAGRNIKFKGKHHSHLQDSHHRSDFDDIDRNCHDGSPAAPSSKAVAGRNIKFKGKHHSHHQDVEDGKYSLCRFPEMQYRHYDRHTVPIFDHGDTMKASKDVASPHSTVGSFMSTRNEDEVKVKTDSDAPVHFGACLVKGNDEVFHVASEHNTGEEISVSVNSVRGPNAIKRKRLVRNGCISPLNIAKAKISAESSSVSSCADFNGVSGGSHNIIHVDIDIANENAADRSKGKGVIHPSSSKAHVDRRADARLNNSSKIVLGKSSSSSALSAHEQVFELHDGEVCTPSPSKRHRKHGSSSSTQEEEREIICLSSCSKTLAAKSKMDHRGHPQRALDSPIVVGDFFPELRECDLQAEHDNETRAIQLQVDERMARELQEQLYNEMPVEATSGERESLLASEGSLGPASFRGRQRAHNIGVRASNTRGISQFPSLRNRLFRPRVLPSSVARLRARINRHSSMVASGRSGRLFPSEMDVDMRMELLEAFEAVAGDDIMMVNQLLNPDQEFGENDYEMLSALDDNNHEHLGASVDQIANLPESTVHIESTEVCSICLETPDIGDTIRHLRCLHKFHKDCIDQWLRRKRSCPICKSDIC